MEFSSLDIHDFSDISDELVTDMKDSVLNRLNADAGQGFLCEAHEDKRYRRKTQHFRDECQAETFQGAKKDSTSLKRRDRETENLTF